MLQLQDIVLHRGDRLLFDDLSFVVHAGQHVALVGRNGAGKSTLFSLIRKRLGPEEGNVLVPSSWRVVHMAQEAPASDRSALDFVIDGHAELRDVERAAERAASEQGRELEHANLLQRFDDLGGYQAEAEAAKILHGLGFEADTLNNPVESFSGGWRVRLALAQTLMTPADLLLLDEPTNHLDLEATLWLERRLASFPGTLLTIAHDRDFLDRATGYTVHLENGRATQYAGNYSAFERQYAERATLAAAEARKAAAKRKQIEAFVNRFRAKASKARQVQSRLKALEKLDASAVLQAQNPYDIAFSNADKVSRPVLKLDDAALGYPDHPVLDEVKLSIQPGARIGVLGKNGAGKSTLLKTIAGEIEPRAGQIVRGKHSSVGYFAQHQMELLDGRRSAIVELRALYPERFAPETPARSYLGGWGFSGDDVFRPIDTFSGGERARLVLALIAASEPALLILDEPTNHLDLDMRAALAFALQAFNGAMLLVSHDRHLLRQCVDELWLVDGGRLREFGQDLDAYERGDLAPTTAQPESSREAAAASTTAEPAPPERNTRKDRERVRAERAARRAATRPLRREIERLETEMEALIEDLTRLEARLAEPDAYSDENKANLNAWLQEQGQLKARLEQIEQSWLNRQEALEAAEASETQASGK
ncbi:MAG: ABC-F family ATP-binding cassette domain-containing protein [Pseudomonadota bacterium]